MGEPASERAEKTALAIILAAFVALGIVYSVVVPPFEASDELWHYPMVKYIADHWDLPVQDPNNVGPWRQEGSQPPLYYAIAAALTSWIDTSDMEVARHLNPHVDNGVATPDGNINLVVHNPALESFPWRGTVLAVHLVRFLSVLMGAAGVYFTYRVAREVVPGDPAVGLAAAAVHAFTPMFAFISGAVNNDNLMVPLCGLGLWMLLRLAGEREWTTRQALARYLARTGRMVVVPLAGLPPGDVAELLAWLTREHSADVSRFADRLHAATGGNPLFLLETLRTLVEPEFRPQPADWRALCARCDVSFPTDLNQALAQRLARWGPSAVRLAELLAVAVRQKSRDQRGIALEQRGELNDELPVGSDGVGRLLAGTRRIERPGGDGLPAARRSGRPAFRASVRLCCLRVV